MLLLIAIVTADAILTCEGRPLSIESYIQHMSSFSAAAAAAVGMI